MSMTEEKDFFLKLEQADPMGSAVAYSLCYLAPRHSHLPPRFTPDFIHFDLMMLGRPKSALSIRFRGEAWGGSVLSNSLAMPFASSMRQLIDELGSLLDAKASFGDVGHHTYVVDPAGQPKASSLIGRLSNVDRIFGEMAAIANSTAT